MRTQRLALFPRGTWLIRLSVGLLSVKSLWQLSSAALCSPGNTSFSVASTAEAAALASVVGTCSGGSFIVSWIGTVTVEKPIAVADGTALTIVGIDSHLSVLDGAHKVRLFELNRGTLHLFDLGLVNGTGGDGGAISASNSSRVTSTRSTFLRNTASSNGGAVFLEHSDMAVMGDTVFESNSAEYRAGGAVALYAESKLHVAGSVVFVRNAASGTFGDGGAICIYGSSSMISTGNAWFESNYAGEDGGAIYLSGGELTMEESADFVDNHSDRSGGAIFLNEGSCLTATSNISFVFNSAAYGGAIAVDGGYSSLDAVVSMRGGGRFLNNHAALDGGAIALNPYYNSDMPYVVVVLVVTDSTWFEGNAAKHCGGGIYASYGSELRMSASIDFFANTAGDSGGAIYHEAMNGGMVSGARFRGNAAGGHRVASERGWTGGNGGAISMGIADDTFKPFKLKNCTFDGNMAKRRGGMIYLFGEEVVEDTSVTIIDNTAGEAEKYISLHCTV